MIYYKKIEILNYDIIVQKSLDYVKSVPFIYERQLTGPTYRAPEFLSKCPEINESFKEFNLECTHTSFYVMYNNNHSVIHRDTAPNSNIARINLPILNCRGSSTVYYTGGNYVRSVTPGNNTTSYFPDGTDDESIKEVDRVEIDRATVLNVVEPHRVFIGEGMQVPRITLTLSFSTDPSFLLKE
jgi:hypothetical protein